MIVFNSSTLILLAKVELVDIFLAALDEKVTIPKEVERECCEEKRTADALLIEKAIQDGKIAVHALKARSLQGKVLADFPLGKGEAAALTLAVSRKARLLATDDKKAIHASKLLKIPFTTAVDVLVRMYEKGLLEKRAAHLKLEALRKFGRYERDIIEDAKSSLEVK